MFWGYAGGIKDGVQGADKGSTQGGCVGGAGKCTRDNKINMFQQDVCKRENNNRIYNTNTHQWVIIDFTFQRWVN